MKKEKPVFKRWEDLLPRLGVAGFGDPYAQLSPRQLADLALLARMVWLIETGKVDANGCMAKDANQIRLAFAQDGLDADWLLSQRESIRRNRIQKSRNPEVDGQSVQLLGQILPLVSGRNPMVTEFLFTAAVGMCSHMPPPPYTQVVYINAVEPIDINTLEGPAGQWGHWVWVEGIIRYDVSTHIANRADGPMRVETAYTIDRGKITPASAEDLARRVEWERQESEALLYPKLTQSYQSTPGTSISNEAPPVCVPVTILTGFLGSGKTTLLNHILTNRKGLKTAVLVNEFGEIGIDGQLIINRDDSMIELSNGCICCTINGELPDAVRRILARPEPVDYIIVETTGLANPLPVSMAFLEGSLHDGTRLDSIITVVDAENFDEAQTGEIARSQIAYGDILLVNKCDLVDEQRLSELEDRLRGIRNDARIMRSVNGKIPLDMLLNVGLFGLESNNDGHEGCDHAHGQCKHDHDIIEHPAIEGFTSVSFTSERPLSLARFRDFLENRLPAGVFRAKGILWFEEDEHRHILHIAGKRLTIERSDWSGERNCRLVLIGKNLERGLLMEQLKECIADKK